ncbi:hypothetical protein [Bradyrhizobium sp. CCBAU 45389]|uniref:hypothetical protein n=1 Tax=Bradyrhizobium sp. CCBAU 45389 TaxID=858429 RepID=UPI002304DA74|nr:hypothetical protein [Bradyrhizobium sp. CCBAU 45389]
MKFSKFIKHQLILAPLSKPFTSTGTRPVDDDAGTVAKRTNKEQLTLQMPNPAGSRQLERDERWKAVNSNRTTWFE